MENLLVFVVMALMSLGLISLCELTVRSFKSRDSKPVDYMPVVEALSQGLNGDQPGDATHWISAIVSRLSHVLEHFHHH